jgi:hypothetical protein
MQQHGFTERRPSACACTPAGCGRACAVGGRAVRAVACVLVLVRRSHDACPPRRKAWPRTMTISALHRRLPLVCRSCCPRTSADGEAVARLRTGSGARSGSGRANAAVSDAASRAAPPPYSGWLVTCSTQRAAPSVRRERELHAVGGRAPCTSVSHVVCLRVRGSRGAGRARLGGRSTTRRALLRSG